MHAQLRMALEDVACTLQVAYGPEAPGMEAAAAKFRQATRFEWGSGRGAAARVREGAAQSRAAAACALATPATPTGSGRQACLACARTLCLLCRPRRPPAFWVV